MEYRITLTVQTDMEFPSDYPDVSIETYTVVSIFPDDTGEEILGRVIAIACEEIHV